MHLKDTAEYSLVVAQDSRLGSQLHALEQKLAKLTGEDQEAIVEELALCRQLLHVLSSTTQPSKAVQEDANPPYQEAQPAAAQQNGHRDATHQNDAAANAPLLLGPP